VRTREFQVAAALASLLTRAATIQMPPVAMPLDLGLRDIGNKMVFELAGRFEIGGTAMRTLLGVNVVFDEFGVWRRLGPEGPGVLAMLLATVVRARAFGGIVTVAGAFAALADLLEFVLQLRQPTTQFGVLRFQLSDPFSKLLFVHGG
jgi:hypothetical protein